MEIRMKINSSQPFESRLSKRPKSFIYISTITTLFLCFTCAWMALPSPSCACVTGYIVEQNGDVTIPSNYLVFKADGTIIDHNVTQLGLVNKMRYIKIQRVVEEFRSRGPGYYDYHD